jgi:hypothetical protein
VANPETGCRCGSGAHPRECKLHPELYRLHVAELNVEGYLPEDDPAAHKAMDELLASITEALKKRKDEIERLTRLVFQSNPNLKSYSLLKFWKEPKSGIGGATDYEVWLRSIDYRDLDYLVRLHTGAIDALRYRRRFIQHELERRYLHSSYGKHPAEFLFELEPKP